MLKKVKLCCFKNKNFKSYTEPELGVDEFYFGYPILPLGFISPIEKKIRVPIFYIISIKNEPTYNYIIYIKLTKILCNAII